MDLKLGGRLGFWVLKSLAKRPVKETAGRQSLKEDLTSGSAKLEQYFGRDIWTQLDGRVVLDFGCGEGEEAIAAARHGAKRVYGIDIRDVSLEIAQKSSRENGVHDTCVFLNGISQDSRVREISDKVEFAYSLDSFEHFSEPKQILDQLYSLLAPGGELYVSFGPPWKHPFGCHMFFFNSLPWMHFIFKEETIMAVRAVYRQDGAKRFGEVEGGLNQMTVVRFIRLAENSNFQIEKLRLIPIKGLSWLVRNHSIREYFTSVVQCVLKKPLEKTKSSSKISQRD
jgi:2-polyprenyl-3-methyl-5-hydroxy-6-metoxy-1,4-benzoquinol methylase